MWEQTKEERWAVYGYYTYAMKQCLYGNRDVKYRASLSQ